VIATPTFALRARQRAAKLRFAASSVAPVAYGYARSLRPCVSGFSRLPSAACSGG